MYTKNKSAFITILIIVFFLLSSYLSHLYSNILNEMILLKGITGVSMYFLITTLAVVVAPVSTLPLLPLAVTLWGPGLAAIVSIIGWLVGAGLAFGIARRFGQGLVYKFINPRNIKKWDTAFPKQNLFWFVVLARFVLPIDIISYVVGLFTTMSWLPYLIATFIGITPFAFIFAYGSELPISLQAAIGLMVLLLVIFGYNNMRKQWQLFRKDSKDQQSATLPHEIHSPR